MEIQESKKDLASVLFAPHEDGQAENAGRLEVCSSPRCWDLTLRKSLEIADDEIIVALQSALTEI